MNFKQYAKFADIETWSFSFYGYFLGALYILFYLKPGHWNWLNALVFFVCEMIFDNMITGINHTMDYLTAKDEKTKRNSPIETDHISIRTALIYIYVLMTIACIGGLWLCFRTNWVMFFVGGLIFLITVTYTSGPFPICRTPIGESICGLAQGLGVPFLFVYVNNNFKQLMTLNFNWTGDWQFILTGSLMNLLAIFFISLPSVSLNSGVLLANNIADHDRDKKNGRATMPIVFGIPKAIIVYRILEYLPYLAIIVSVVFRFAPYTTILTLGTIPWVKKNTDKFIAKPDKQKTFMTSIFNFHIVVVTEIITMLVGYLIHF